MRRELIQCDLCHVEKKDGDIFKALFIGQSSLEHIGDSSPWEADYEYDVCPLCVDTLLKPKPKRIRRKPLSEEVREAMQ